MASLGEMYSHALGEKLAYQKGWVPNWPPSFPVELGRVGEIVRDGRTGVVSLDGNNRLEDYGITRPPEQVGPKTGPRSFSWGTETKVDFGVGASTKGFEWLGAASVGLRATFGKEGGLQAEAVAPRHHGFCDSDSLRADLLAAAKLGKLRCGKALVVEFEQVERAVVIASESSSGSIEGSVSADLAPSGVSLSSFATGLAVRSRSGQAVVSSYPEPTVTAFKALVVGTRGLWWWRHIAITMANFSGEDARLRSAFVESQLDDDDYDVRF